MDLLDFGQALNEADSKGARLNLKNPNTGELLPDAWLDLRSLESPECQAEVEKADRSTAKLRARGDKESAEKIYDPDRRDRIGVNVLAAAFIRASSAIQFNGQPITANNIALAFADPRLKFVRDQAVVFIAQPENFPMATADTSATANPSTSTTGSSAISSSSSSASSN